VNGALVGSTPFTPTWMSTGGLTVGRDIYNGADTDYFPGWISDVRAYNDATVWAFQASEIYNDTGTSSITASNVQTAFEYYAAAEPNLRDVIVSVGANDVLEGVSATTIENHLAALVSDIVGRSVNDEPGVPVQALITTIPPLNLAASDPREAVRRIVNSWIMGSGTEAVAALDIASAVDAGSSNQNDIAAQYLTDGVPNAAYYARIANAVIGGMQSATPPVSF
jgi:hypothetical protein